MTIIDLPGDLEISLVLSKAGFWLVRSKQALNIFIQTRLVLFDRPEVISTLGYDLLRDCPLGMQDVSSHNFASQQHSLQYVPGGCNLIYLAVHGFLRQQVLIFSGLDTQELVAAFLNDDHPTFRSVK